MVKLKVLLFISLFFNRLVNFNCYFLYYYILITQDFNKSVIFDVHCGNIYLHFLYKLQDDCLCLTH